MKKNISTVIEITNLHVKFYQFENIRNQRIMTSFDVKSICDFTDDEIVEILIGMLRSKNVQAEELVFVVPRRLVILKQMRLPSKNEEEIKEMVELQLINKIPYSLEDISFHCHLLVEDSTGYSQVLVIIMHKEVSDRYLKIFSKIGINLNRLTLSSFGILEWLEFQRRKKEINADGPVAIVDIDTDYSEICFCHNGKLLFSRSFDGGAKDLSEENIFRLTKQIELSLGMYQKEDMGSPIREMIILSTLSEKELLRDKLERQLQIPTKIFMPVENVLHQKNLKISVAKEQPGISLSVGLGLGLADMKKIVNLAPQKVHDTKQGKIRKQQLIKFSALFVLACVLGVSIPGLDLYYKSTYLKGLKSEVNAIRPKASKALQQMKFVQSFNEKFGKRVFISDLLYDLYDLTPLEISFRSLYLNERGHLMIQGYAQTSGSINNFQSALVKSKTFKDVNLQSSTKRRIFNTEVMDFKINTRLTIAEKSNND